ncbi:MAG: GNAT family N-acetyltransferase [Pseudomonadota bacterium]
MEIRIANQKDREACVELLLDLIDVTGEHLSRAAREAFDSLLDGQRGQVIVAEDDGELLGMVSLSYNVAMRYGGEYCQVEEVVVDPAARGRKVSSALMEAALDHARRRGCEEVGAYVVDNASENRSFYEKFGFVQVGVEMRQRLDN